MTKSKPLDLKCTHPLTNSHFFPGGPHCGALTKFIQQNERAGNLKIAMISKDSVWVQPQAYFGILHSYIKTLKMETGTLSAQIDTWSKIEAGSSVTKLDPNANKLTLSNGKEFSYKALVLGTGFDHSADYIEGLSEFDQGHESNNVFVHQLDSKTRVDRNFYNGWMQRGGDYINYSPAVPYKGEGTDFYTLYYETLLRQDKLVGAAAAGS